MGVIDKVGELKNIQVLAEVEALKVVEVALPIGAMTEIKVAD